MAERKAQVERTEGAVEAVVAQEPVAVEPPLPVLKVKPIHYDDTGVCAARAQGVTEAWKKPGLRNIFIHKVGGELRYSQKYRFMAQSILEMQVEIEKAVEPFEVPNEMTQGWYSGALQGLAPKIKAFNAARERLLAAHLALLHELKDGDSCDPGAAPTQDEV